MNSVKNEKHWSSVYRQRIVKRQPCGHCGSNAVSAACAQCGRVMCEDCISHDPNTGKVCGLYYDRMHPDE